MQKEDIILFENSLKKTFPSMDSSIVSKIIKAKEGEQIGIQLTETRKGIKYSIWYYIHDWTTPGLRALKKKYRKTIKETKLSIDKLDR
jgi:hypothetical protein